MCTNLNQLRKEAYRLWGLGNSRVIHDFPKRPGHLDHEFFFRFDYGEGNASWPRAYALAVGDDEPLLRVLSPIIAIRRYRKFQTETNAWYDLPMPVHERIVELVDNSIVTRRMSFWKRTINRVLPRPFRFTGKVDMEDYVYGVILHNGEHVIRLL